MKKLIVSSFSTGAVQRVFAFAMTAWSLFASTLAHGQHTNGANDFLIDALRIGLDGKAAITTTGYTTEPNEPGTSGTRTAWFVWTAPEDKPALVRFSTYGSSYNTIITLFKKNVTILPAPASLISSLILVPVTTAPENLVNTDDDTALGVNTGYITWVPQAGATYFISVGRSGGGGGGSNLEATLGAVTAADGLTPAVPNDNLASALQFTAVVTTPLTQRITGQPISGTTIAASAEAGEQAIGLASDPEGGTVWYKYTTGVNPEVFSVVLRDLPSDVLGDFVLQAFQNTVPPAIPTFAQLTFQEEDSVSSRLGQPRLVIDGTANTEYYFRVTSTDGDGALFKIQLDYSSLAPVNDTIASAIPLSSTLPVVRNQGENIYSATQTDLTGFAGNTSGANVWYSWKAPANGLVSIRAIVPSATSTTGNFEPLGGTFEFDAEVYFDTTNPTDLIFDTTTAQGVASFSETTTPQERTFYAIKDVVYFIEIGGDNNINTAGRGFFGFALEDARLLEVARTGVSYGPEGVLKTISAPVMNKNGDISFPATLELGGPVNVGNSGGLFFFNGSNTRVVVTKGEQEFATALDVDGDGLKDDRIVFATFSDLFLADRTNATTDLNADLGFTAGLSGKSDDAPLLAANNKAFYHDDTATDGTREFRLTDYVNNSLTWRNGGGFLGAFNTPVRKTAGNNSNSVLVTGKMSGIPSHRDTALFASIAPRVVIQEEDPAPGTADVTDPLLNAGPGAEFGDFSGIPTVNSQDALAFRAVLRGPGVSSANDTVIYSVADYNSAPTDLNYRLRLREGTPALGAAGTTLAGGANLFTLGEPRLNGKSRLAVVVNFKIGGGSPAVSRLDDTAILSDLLSNDQSFALVAREGDFARSAVGQTLAGVKFASFLAPVLITNNAVVFTAKVNGTGVNAGNDTGIWIWDGSSTYLVAREGDPAPGVLPTGANFGSLGSVLANPNGRIAFTASLSGPGVGKTNDAGLWTLSEDAVTPLLRLRKGELYNFGRTELPIYRAVTSIAITPGSAGDDGFARAMDQDGNVAVLVGLGKGGQPNGQAVLKVSP